MNRIVSTLSVFAIVVIVVLSGCGSGKVALQHGNYYEAVITSVNHLRRSPDHKKSIETLRSAYPMGVAYYEGLVTGTLAPNGQFKWTEVVGIYITLNSMGDEIRRCPGALRVIPNPKNYSAQLTEARQKAAEEQYQAGIMALGAGSRDKAKLAYSYFKRSIEFVPGYRDAAQKMQEALWAATVKVLVEPIPTQSRNLQASTDAFNTKVSEYLHQNQLNEFVKFYTPAETQQLKLYPDHIVRLDFEEFNVGNVYMTEKQIPLKRDSVLVSAIVNNQTIVINNTNVTNNNVTNNTTVNNNTVNNNTTNNNTVNNNTVNNNTTNNTTNNSTVNNTTNNTSNTNTTNNNTVTNNTNTENKVVEEKKEEKKEDPKSEVKGEKKEEKKEEAKAEVKEEKKTETKEEPKTEAKEEKNESVKEEKKEEKKDESKSELKEEKRDENKNIEKEEKKEEDKKGEKEDKEKDEKNEEGKDDKKDKAGDEKKSESETKFEAIPESEQVVICHLPPGNASARHTLTVSKSALKAHLEHGDFEGSCEDPKNANKLKEVDKKAADQKKNENKGNDNKGSDKKNDDKKGNGGGGFAVASYQPVLIASSSNEMAWQSLLNESFDTTKIYASVKATLNYYAKTVSSKGVVMLTILDAKTKAVLSVTRIPREYLWASEWATFNGDERALNAQQITLIKNKEKAPPSQQEMFQAFVEPVFNQVVQKLQDFYKGY